MPVKFLQTMIKLYEYFSIKIGGKCYILCQDQTGFDSYKQMIVI